MQCCSLSCRPVVTNVVQWSCALQAATAARAEACALQLQRRQACALQLQWRQACALQLQPAACRRHLDQPPGHCCPPGGQSWGGTAGADAGAPTPRQSLHQSEARPPSHLGEGKQLTTSLAASRAATGGGGRPPAAGAVFLSAQS